MNNNIPASFVPDPPGFVPDSSGIPPSFVPDPPATPSSGGDWLSKTAHVVNSIFPGGKMGEAIGTLGGFGLQKLHDAFTGQHTADNYDLSAPTPLQTGGDAAMSLLSAGMGGVPKGVASIFPGLEESAPIASRFFQGKGFLPAMGRIATQAGLGGAMGAAGALASGNNDSGTAFHPNLDMGGILHNTELGAAINGGLSAAGELGAALVDNFASKTPESRLLQQKDRLKTLQNSFDDNTTYTRMPDGSVGVKTDPIKTLTSLNLTPEVVDGRVSTEKIDTTLQHLIDKQDAVAKGLVDNIHATVPLELFKSEVEKAVMSNPQIRDSGKLQQALNEVNKRFSSYGLSFGQTNKETGEIGGEITYKIIDNIRTAMNREYDPEMRDVARTIGDVSRKYLYSQTESPELASVMSTQGDLLKAQNFVDKLRGTVVRGGRLGKYLAQMTGAGVGTLTGSALGPFGSGAGMFAGGIAADKAMNIYQNSYFKPVFSEPANSLSSFISTPATQSAIGYGKAGVLFPSTGKN